MTAYDNDNIFAKILRGELPCFKVHEDDETLVFMDIMPRGEGHCLVIPKEPCRNLLDASPQAIAAVHQVSQRIAKAAMT
ncbi:MAG: HIT domain-containing protein, partial [Pseudomonadota bacterium]